MLTIPWFVTSTVRDLLRYPKPYPQDQHASQQQQQQLQQQQQQQATKQEPKPQQQHNPPQRQNLVYTPAPPPSQNNTTPLQPKPTPAKLNPNQVPLQQGAHPSASTASSSASSSSSLPTSVPRQAAASPKLGQDQKAVVKPASPAPKRAIPVATKAGESDVKTSSATLVLTPSVSGNKMSSHWCQQQVDKFAFDFDKADKDKSGTLSVQEVIDVLRSVGFNGSDTEAKFIFQHLDKNDDRKITKDEFKASLSKMPQMSIKEFALRKAFLQMDKDKSGFLSRDEVMDATKSEEGSIPISAKVISDILVYLCEEDKDQKVGYDEFLYVLGLEESASVLNQIFKKLDTDGSGFLSKTEILDSVSNEHELDLQAGKISDLLNYWCKDADKKISYHEFVEVWLKQKEKVKKTKKH